jgi:hypothetical protein
MVEICDGFGAHLSSLQAMQERYDNKIIAVKEEGDLSHVNQAYDKFVAKADKKAGNESLGMLRSATYLNRGVVDQWGLIHVGLYAIRETKRETWIRSFEACNLHPVTRMAFGDWCAKIEQYLQVDQSFEDEAVAVDKYTLLPSWWHAMKPEEKRNAFDVIKENGGFTMECLIELRELCKIPTKDMQNMRVCYECSKETPDHLQRTLPIESTCTSPLNEDVHQAQAAVASVNAGLVTYQLKPEGMKGEELFAHMIWFRESRNWKGEEFDVSDVMVSPGRYLDVEVKPENRAVLRASTGAIVGGNITAKRNILKDAFRGSARMKIPKRTLDQYALIKSHSGIMNSERNLNRMKNQMMLAKSLGEIEEADRQIKKTKIMVAEETLKEKAPGALIKLSSKKGDVDKLYKGEISSLFFAYYGLYMDEEKTKKPELVNVLKEKIQDNRYALQRTNLDLSILFPATTAEPTGMLI